MPWSGGTRPCTCLPVLLRWPTRYSAPAPCERARYFRGLVFLGQAKGVQPIRLPFNSLLVPARQIAARVAPSKLARYSAALVFLPLKPSARDWAALPHGALLRELYARKVRKEGDCCQLRVGARAE